MSRAFALAAALAFAPGCGSAFYLIEPGMAPVSLPTPSAEVAVPARARYQYLVGRLAIEEGDWEGAERALRTALLHDAQSPWIWLALADVAAGEGEELEERRRVQEAVKVGPDVAEAWTRLGQVSARAGDARVALDAWREAVHLGAGAEAWLPLCRMLLDRDDPAAESTVRAWGEKPLTEHADLRERGHMRLQVGDLPGAVADLGEALVHAPQDARLLDEYLTAVTGSGLYRQGLARLATLHRVAPRDTDVLLRTYHLATQAQDHVRAVEALTALDALLGGREAQVKLWLADAQSALGHHDEALAALRAGGRAKPPIADAGYHQARFLRAAGRSEEALAALVVPASGPHRPDAIALRARLLVEVGRAAEGRAVVEAALRALPDDYVLLGALVSVCGASGDREGMLAAIDRMAMLDPEARARTRARALAGLGDLEGALAALRAGGPAQAESWALGGALLREAGRTAEAVQWLERGVAVLPADAALYAELGLARVAAGQDERALAAIRAALGVDAADPVAARVFAREMLEDGRGFWLRQARGHVLAALERRPADAELLTALGRLEHALGEPLRALEAWEEACLYARPDAVLLARLADTYRELGRPEQARTLEERYRP